MQDDPTRNRLLNIRLSDAEIATLKSVALEKGYKNTSTFVREIIRGMRVNGALSEEVKTTPVFDKPKIYWKNKLGKIYHGDSRGLLSQTLKPESVDLVMTSPPFALRLKKAYGNEDASQYLEWFKPFAAGIRRVLKESGSLVIDIGPAWQEKIPAKSLYQFELLTMLCKEFGFYLAQDLYWWNPSRMPAPAEWVNVRRLRVKDSVNPIWWLSPTPWPKASNRRVLTPYTKSQEALFRVGYNSGARPSGHVVSEVWNRNNGGAIPPNLIAAPNTVSDDKYQTFCRDNDLVPHPARFPWALPEFFIRMLTNKDDLVVDPFAGSCMTGAVAELFERRWACCEIKEEYLEGAASRFDRKHRRNAPAPTVTSGYRVPVPKPADLADHSLVDCYGGKPPPG